MKAAAAVAVLLVSLACGYNPRYPVEAGADAQTAAGDAIRAEVPQGVDLAAWPVDVLAIDAWVVADARVVDVLAVEARALDTRVADSRVLDGRVGDLAPDGRADVCSTEYRAIVGGHPYEDAGAEMCSWNPGGICNVDLSGTLTATCRIFGRGPGVEGTDRFHWYVRDCADCAGLAGVTGAP